VAVTVVALLTKSGDPAAVAISALGFTPMDGVLQVTAWLVADCSVRLRMIRSGSSASCSRVVTGEALILAGEHPMMRSSIGRIKSLMNLESAGVKPHLLELKSILIPFEMGRF
jgi:hypothetical protein